MDIQRKQELDSEHQQLLTEYVELCNRQQQIKARISAIGLELYEMEYPDVTTDDNDSETP